MIELRQLKSGSDIRGTAGEILNEQTVSALAVGFAKWANAKKVAIGHDSRLSASTLTASACEALIKNRIDVNFCGLCSTPSMFMTTVLHGVDVAIMFTASHHPKDKNGMKFFCPKGGVTGKELEEIIVVSQEFYNTNYGDECGKNHSGNCGSHSGNCADLAKDSTAIDNTNSTQNHTVATYCERDFLEDYCAYMRNIFVSRLGEMPLKGVKIAVDAGCGSAGFYADRILAPLGADVSSSQFLNPDGNFPAHAPNPENAEAMASISKRVVETKSDLGVIFDADGDRAGMVLADGTEINRNRLIALISAIILNHKAGASIVTDSVTSEGLHKFIVKRGGVHVRYKRGYQNVISYAKQLNEKGIFAPIAIETSGHAAIINNYFLDDGAYLCAVLIMEAIKCKREGKKLTDLIADLVEPKEEKEFRIKIGGQDWKKTGEVALAELNKCGLNYRIADDSFEGIRVYVDGDDFYMARMSVHDPIMPINIESYVEGGAKNIAKIVYNALKDIDNLDLSALKDYINI